MRARTGGWSALAGSYARSDRPEGTAFRFGSGNLGLASYRGCLWFVSGVRGLHVSVLFLFRPGHPPLFVPWSDVTAHAVRGWVFEHVELGFARQPEVRLRLARSMVFTHYGRSCRLRRTGVMGTAPMHSERCS